MGAEVIELFPTRPHICWPCVATWGGLALFWVSVGLLVWKVL